MTNHSPAWYRTLVERCIHLGVPATEVEDGATVELPLTHHLSIPWYAERLELYAGAGLREKQRGYAFDGRTGKPLAAWLSSWLVIGDASADPIVLDRASGAILTGPHGTGRWELHPMAPDLDLLCHALAVWLDLRQVQFQGSLTDPHHVVRTEVTDGVRAALTPIVGNGCIRSWLGQD